MMTPYLSCSDGHLEVRWAWVAGYSCWFCGRLGRPARGLTITSTLMEYDEVLTDDPDPHGEWGP